MPSSNRRTHLQCLFDSVPSISLLLQLIMPILQFIGVIGHGTIPQKYIWQLMPNSNIRKYHFLWWKNITKLYFIYIWFSDISSQLCQQGVLNMDPTIWLDGDRPGDACMLEYCALNPRCSISCFQTSPSEASPKLFHNCQSTTTLMREGLLNIASDTKETYLATTNQAYLKTLIIGPS